MKLSTALKLLYLLLPVLIATAVFAGSVEFGTRQANGRQIYWLRNNRIIGSVIIEKGKLVADELKARPEWLEKLGSRSLAIQSDADFGLDIQWTGWRAPGKVHNADNPLLLTKENFQLVQQNFVDLADSSKALTLLFRGVNQSFEIQLTYKLKPNTFFIRRKLAVRDPKARGHFLRWFWPRQGFLFGDLAILKAGGFGNPLAIKKGSGGAFFGLEYPASTNQLKAQAQGKTLIRSGQEMGQRIDSTWVESEWVVSGLAPNSSVKLWFNKYLDDIRVAPLKPYLLYNTWYDVRSPEYTDRPEDVMNEKNLLRIIKDFKKEMVEKRGLKLDAFVLDDGWDVYQSDWRLRDQEFPDGLKPIVDALAAMGTKLGIWLGPIGGYSYRKWRVNWMREHGYETVGNQLCIAGKNYHKLFKKRVVDFVRNDGVAYFKWDGIQFSCSEPDHGHPVGIYSRRAVMESVIDLCQAVRAENPEMFLNITSGTWLSPWWLKYANMIWMQGQDYGYANVPSISRRDAAITYRDFVLYEDFGKNDFWFPISNLMTHGIIKGHLQKLGGETEPLDKFTDNAILYFARGVSMWELYISPNLLTNGEWDAIAKSIRWAKDRFDLLKSTEMIGGDPGKEEAYGYAHFSGTRGIVVARNPFIQPQKLRIELAPSQGLDLQASSLVLERVYPSRWISPALYSAGGTIEINLNGYETAIYEIYPVEEATVPLVAGAMFQVEKARGQQYILNLYDISDRVRIHNPEKIRSIFFEGKNIPLADLSILPGQQAEPVTAYSLQKKNSRTRSEIKIHFNLQEAFAEATLSILLRPEGNSVGQELADVVITLNGEKVTPRVEQQKGQWAWYKVPVKSGKHEAKIRLIPKGKETMWAGHASVWLVGRQKRQARKIVLEFTEDVHPRVMPPRPFPAEEVQVSIKLGDAKIQIGSP